LFKFIKFHEAYSYTAQYKADNSWADLDGMSLTISVAAGDTLLVWTHGWYDGLGLDGKFPEFRLLEDGAQIGFQACGGGPGITLNGSWNIARIKTPTGGSHTYKVQFRVTGSGDINAMNRSLIVIQFKGAQ